MCELAVVIELLLIKDISIGSKTAADNSGLSAAGHPQWFKNHN
jgi:hypothetical protein